MGLDIYIYRMRPMDSSRVYTEEEIREIDDDDRYELFQIKPVKGNEDFSVDGASGYLFKGILPIYDTNAMMEKLGIRKEDGWEEDGACSCSQHTSKKKRPPEEDVEWWFQFVNKHGSEKYEDWEYKEFPALYSDFSVVKHEEWWCIATVGDELADMRKGANERFYDDGLWDDNFCPVCSKRVLAEHMEKYFDDGPGYVYENCREAFRNIIFDKFEDGKGLCVIYA